MPPNLSPKVIGPRQYLSPKGSTTAADHEGGVWPGCMCGCGVSGNASRTAEVGPAVEERLVREVMRADRVEWTAAMAIVEDIKRANDRLGLLVHLPHLCVCLRA